MIAQADPLATCLRGGPGGLRHLASLVARAQGARAYGAADATRANMRFVETKAPEQQACLMLHRTRRLFIRQQTSVINAIRAHLAEFRIIARAGRNGVEELLEVATDPADRRLPEVARTCVTALGVQLRMLKALILEFDRRIRAWHQSSQRAAFHPDPDTGAPLRCGFAYEFTA